ncbi:protein NRT1/ PTR FAMILY 4.5-like [Salvia miltiorrhiza]|uniref:protein NRT1/ PTR FAMILY 4.5-like n=1 Tax=Salvia miltiorrhiza TaxID=226208 RepID=UPI0025AD114D|nr:protein NRT1/ PTR FAMILY 4.5-like [Salvia miltiorrhiza]
MAEDDAEKGATPSEMKGKGGLRAASFIYGLAAMESMGFVANMMSLVLYFMYKLHFDLPAAANTFTNLMGTTFLLSVVGGFISDTYINRFYTSIIFGALELLSLAMLTIQAHSKDLLPSVCGIGESSCIEGGKAVYFYATMFLLALGAGGFRGSFPALGADQFDENDPEEVKSLASYFNWLLLSIVGGASIGVTVIVWVSTNHPLRNNWWKGFLIVTIATFFGFIVLVLGKPFYRLKIPKHSPLVRIAQVIAVAVKNRGLPHPESPSELYELSKKDLDSTVAKIPHTQQFRWLDKAAIVGERADASAWEVCTVTQVEEVKVVARMLPIIGSTIIMNTCLAQLQTFSVQQGNRMDPHLGSFKVPAASIPIIPLLFMVILIPVYDAFFVPLARRLTGHPSGISQLQRVGVGLVLAALSMSVAALVEVKRRRRSLGNPLAPISLFWLSFQYGIFGIADMFTMVGLLEFFYKEAPAGMKSLSTSFTWISLSLGYFLSSALVEAVTSVTKRVTPSKRPWVYGIDLDRNNLDLFYWLLAVLSVVNFFHYLYWAMWYKYKSGGDEAAAPAAAVAEESAPKVASGGGVAEQGDGDKVGETQ